MASRCTTMHSIKESRENKDYGKHFGKSSLIVFGMQIWTDTFAC